MLNNFINDQYDGAEPTISKFADDTKLGGETDMPEGHVAIQRDLDRHLIQFNKGRCKLLHLGRNNTVHQYLLVDTKLTTSHQCALVTRKTTRGIRRNIASRSKEVILPPALVRHEWGAESSPGLPIQGRYGFTAASLENGSQDD